MGTRVGRLLVHEHGDPARPTVLLLHGVTDSGRTWGDLVERLVGRVHLVAPDALGHGGSERPTAAELDDDPVVAMTAAAEVLLERLAAARPVVVLGHSMGAATAVELAVRRPELVAAVVLEDPPWHAPRTPQQQDRVVSRRVADTVAAAADPAGAAEWCRAEHPTWPASELEPWARAKADVDLDLLHTGRVLPAGDWRDRVADLVVPTLLVTGDVDVRVDASVRAELAAIGNPVLEVAVVRGAGHCVRRDRAAAFHGIVDPWLSARMP